MICVNDGSTDDTLARLLALHREDPRLVVIDLSRNFGKEAALTAGLDHARGDCAISLDVDLKYLSRMMEAKSNRQQPGAPVGSHLVATSFDRFQDASTLHVPA